MSSKILSLETSFLTILSLILVCSKIKSLKRDCLESTLEDLLEYLP
jgi:hypothetical protein